MTIVKRLVKELTQVFGFEIRRRPDADLPFVHSIRCDGEMFAFWIANEHTKRWWHAPELGLNAELRSLRAMCEPGSIVFDVGAHHGMTAVLCARWAGPSGHVHAFEGNSTNALVLAANVGLNNLRNCTWVHAVVGADAGISGMAGEVVAIHGSREGRPVERISLDEYCRHSGVDRVDVLKVDVEGFEAEVLKGARRLLEQRPKMDIEIHMDELPRFGASASEVLRLIGVESYDAFAMIRPDWESMVPLREDSELPTSGVINLFLWPK
jgi:FkbM family methyltransferase